MAARRVPHGDVRGPSHLLSNDARLRCRPMQADFMKWMRLLCWIIATVFVAAFNIAAALAHDIPNAVSLHAFVKPERDRLHLLIRIPLELLGSLDLPKRGPGYV